MTDQVTDKRAPDTRSPGRPRTSDAGSGEALPFRYDAALAGDIELAWQARWEAAGTFHAPNPSGPMAAGSDRMAGRPKFYICDMFPYASDIGIHVGHPVGYIATDVYARFLRMTGHHVLHAMGYDAFGLPAEQYALGTGQHPQVTTRQNIDNMRRQLRRLGLGHDSRRSVETTDPRFYRWTQWIFKKIFDSWVDDRTGRARPITELAAEYASGARAVPGGRAWAELADAQRREVIDSHRLAYVAEEPVNWCPGLGTVLANEEVTADGRSDIGDFPVYRRPLRQWMMRITVMAQRLIDDLDQVDWPENVKQMQRNWIGASDGASIFFAIAASAGTASPGADPTAASATAASPGTASPGADPAGPAGVEVFTTRPDTLSGATYVVLAPEHPLVDALVAETWPDRTPEAWRYPQGRVAAGAPAWRPADAVAAYREATTRRSDRQRTADGAKSGVFTGGYVINPMTDEPLPVFVADYVLMGYGTGAIMGVPAHDERDQDFASEFGLPVRDVERPAGLDQQGAIDASVDWLERHGHGQAARRYRLRDWLFSRQRYWGEPFPIVYDEAGPIALPDDVLPVVLPEMTDFRPSPVADETSEPVPPLARAADWATVELDLGDGVRSYRRELNTMPQWAGSCWYYLRYLDPDNDAAFADPVVERYWMEPGGVDLYVGGIEHAVLHLLYARFWHKVLYDLGLVSTSEPFARLVNQGIIQADAFVDERGFYVPAAEVVEAPDGSASYQGRPVTRRVGRMGKSKKNGVSPDDMISQYGADTLRLYEMALGPIDVDRPWRTGDIVGMFRFLQRLWRCVVDEQTGELTVTGQPLDGETERALHATIAVVRRDIGQLRFNTAIARLTGLTTLAARIAARDGGLPRALAEPLVLMTAPLAPHIAEELWSRLGHSGSLAYAEFPQADQGLAAQQVVTIPVQVNGRTRFTIEIPADAGQAETEQILTAHPAYAQHVGHHTVERLVVVPGRIVNVVAGP